LGEACRHRRPLDGGGVDARRVDRVPGALPVRRLCGVAAPRERAEVGERTLRPGVADDDHAPALTGAPARREAGLVEGLRQRVRGQWIRRELAGGEGRAQNLVELHERSSGSYPSVEGELMGREPTAAAARIHWYTNRETRYPYAERSPDPEWFEPLGFP